MFNVDFKDIKFQLTPHFLRRENLLKFMFSVIKPLKTINNDGVVVESFGQPNSSLHQFILFITNFLNFDARTIFLEKFLNDIYAKVTQRWEIQQFFLLGDKVIFDGQNYIALADNVGEQPDLNPADWETTGIEIINDNTTQVQYLFNDAEQGTDFFMFNNFDTSVSYSSDDFVAFENEIFQANTGTSPGESPTTDPGKWDFEKDIDFMFNFSDQLPFDYRVLVPVDITLQPDYSNDRIKNQIKQLNAAGISFDGVVKEDITIKLFNSRE